MKIIIGFCIFCLVLFVYLHVQFHLKTSEDLELYEVDAPSKDTLEELCDLRQPVLFDFDAGNVAEASSLFYLAHHYPAFELKIRNVSDLEPDDVPLPSHAVVKLFNEDNGSQYYTENNADFLNETGVAKHFQCNDAFLRPYMVSNCNYDVLAGSEGTQTPFRYEVNYRNYFMLSNGTARIKLTPPHSTKYLNPIHDYEHFEFRSPVNPWAPQAKFVTDFDKVKCMEFTLTPGKTLYIPAFWWYSIQFGKGASISCFRYRTYMNNVAISPYIFLHALQLQNVKCQVAKTSIGQLKDGHEQTEDIRCQTEDATQLKERNQPEEGSHPKEMEGTPIESIPDPVQN